MIGRALQVYFRYPNEGMRAEYDVGVCCASLIQGAKMRAEIAVWVAAKTHRTAAHHAERVEAQRARIRTQPPLTTTHPRTRNDRIPFVPYHFNLR